MNNRIEAWHLKSSLNGPWDHINRNKQQINRVMICNYSLILLLNKQTKRITQLLGKNDVRNQKRFKHFSLVFYHYLWFYNLLQHNTLYPIVFYLSYDHVTHRNHLLINGKFNILLSCDIQKLIHRLEGKCNGHLPNQREGTNNLTKPGRRLEYDGFWKIKFLVSWFRYWTPNPPARKKKESNSWIF